MEAAAKSQGSSGLTGAMDLSQMVESLAVLGTGSQDSKRCCGALYDSGAVRMLLGDTLHPGGLRLTNRLGKLVDIKRGDLVLDVACGRGTSAMAVARSFHCRMVGLDLGASVGEARGSSQRSGLDSGVAFLRGDAEAMPLAGGSFDAALCECSMSLFPDKESGVAEMARLLKPGGRLGVSDVTVAPSTLPEELMGTLGRILCVAEAPSVEGYRRLLGSHGLSIVHEEDASHTLAGLLAEVEGKLAGFRMLLSLGGDGGSISALISLAFPILQRVRGLVDAGNLGYRLFVAEKVDSLVTRPA